MKALISSYHNCQIPSSSQNHLFKNCTAVLPRTIYVSCDQVLYLQGSMVYLYSLHVIQKEIQRGKSIRYNIRWPFGCFFMVYIYQFRCDKKFNILSLPLKKHCPYVSQSYTSFTFVFSLVWIFTCVWKLNILLNEWSQWGHL